MKPQSAESLHRQIRNFADIIGAVLTDAIHYLVLLAIGVAIVWSAFTTVVEIASRGNVAIRDILLLFIYLELVAMIGIHFRTKRIPVRYLIYIAITALTRLLIINVQAAHGADIGVVLTSGAILILALTILVIRYGSHKFPLDSGLRVAPEEDDSHVKTD